MDDPADEPLQLIEFVRQRKDQPREIRLNHDTLDLVLNSCGQRPISVFCVCGPSRKGKSFLLGYMIRCLEALEKEETDWMGWNSPKNPLNGFKFRNGVKPETQGIWVWSRPFVIKSEERKEVCVLLVDTQGTQDEFTTTQDMSAIVGLSLLLSSVMIFNFFTDLQEDTLVALNTYIQYGLLALDSSDDDEPPFQKISFLIRDWNMPGDFLYGSKGGRRFLENKLEIKTDQSEEAKTLRRNIKKCFQNLDCFLLPHIGLKALNGNFKGSISELDSKFACKLEEFINSIIGSDDIIVKEVLGMPTSAQEFKSYLQMYVETFNSEDIPSPSNMLEATTKLHNDILVKNAEERYRAKILWNQGERRFFSEQDLQEAHKSAEKAALSYYRKAKTFGDADTIKAYKLKLSTKISDLFTETRKQNDETRRRIIADATENATSNFRDELDKSFPLRSNTDFFEDNDLSQTEEQIKCRILEEFKGHVVDESPDVLQKLVDHVIKQLSCISEELMSKNNTHRSNAERKILEIINCLFESYKVTVWHHFEDNKFGVPEEIETFHKSTEAEVTQLFIDTDKPGGPEFHGRFLKTFGNQIVEFNQKIMEQLQRSQKDAWEKALATINNECKNLLTQLRLHLESESFETEYQKLKTQTTTSIITDFPYKKGSDYYSKLVEAIEENTGRAFEAAEHERQALVHKYEESINNAVQECIQVYQNEMKDCTDKYANSFIEDQSLKEAHHRIKQNLIDMFHKAPKFGPMEKSQDIFNDKLLLLNTRLEEIFEEFCRKNESNFVKAKLETTLLATECASTYEQTMKEMITKGERTKEYLEVIHQDCKRLAIETFNAQCPLNCCDFTKSQCELLEAKVESTYDLYLREQESAEIRLEDSRKAAIQNGAEVYRKEIKEALGEKFVADTELDDIHEKLQQKLLDELKSKLQNCNRLEPSIQDLKSQIDVIFESAKTENSDRLDSAKLKAVNFKNDCRADYAKLMRKASEVAKTEEELMDHHQTAKANALKIFKEKCSIQILEILKDFLESLSADIEEAYEECLELFELKSTEDDTKLKSILIDCRQHYHSEMESQFNFQLFVQPEDLEALHKNTSNVVLRKLATATGHISEEQRRDIVKEMDDQFVKFKLKNDMKLNYKTGVAPAIGIDLGTTYCCVGVFYQGKVIIVPNQDHAGNLTIPSYVAFNKNNEDVVVGEAAKEAAYKNLDNTIYDAKRILGRTMDDPNLQSDIKMWPFTLKEDDGLPKILVNGKLLYPEQVSGRLLAYLKSMTEKYLKLTPGTIKKAVITVPAYFNDGQRQATVDAGKLAGLEVLTILNEPTAAAVAYSLERMEKTAKKVLVYDLGGGTFDVAVLDMKPNEIDVLGVDGDTHLGGEDFDKNIMTYCAEKFKEMHGFDMFKNKDSADKAERDDAKRRLRRVQTYCENIKKQLSTASFARVSIDAIANGLDMDVEVSRETFDALNEKEFRKTIEIVERVLETTGVKKEDIDDVVLVGGSSRILKVQEMLKSFFRDKALNHAIHPDHCVAHGAAVKAAMMNGAQSRGELSFEKIQDVTPLSLGVENSDDTFSVVVPRNTKIPCSLTQSRITVEKDQTSMRFCIYQGEKRIAKSNTFLGEFILEGVPPGEPGEFPAEVTMKINSLGILHATAICKHSGTTSSITITEKKQRMSNETIAMLIKEGKK